MSYFTLLPKELIHKIVIKTGYNLELYGIITYFDLNYESVFRDLSIIEYEFMSKYKLNMNYKGFPLSWRRIYEYLQNIEIVKTDYLVENALKYSKIKDIIDVIDIIHMERLIDRDDHVFLLLLMDYQELLQRNTSNIKIIRYEVLLCYYMMDKVSISEIYIGNHGHRFQVMVFFGREL